MYIYSFKKAVVDTTSTTIQKVGTKNKIEFYTVIIIMVDRDFYIIRRQKTVITNELGTGY